MNFERHPRQATSIFILILLLLLAAVVPAADPVSTEPGYFRQTVRAPELTGGHGWLNTDEPLSLRRLRGKIVLLDFWTYGCVNCIHIIPDLKKLEAKYGNELVVIGVHSAKFDNEKETANIRNIILRYGIEHPVVNDSDFNIWQAYAVRAWPTRVLIDPDGYVVAKVSGEGRYDYFDTAIGELADKFRKSGKLDETPLKFALEKAKVGSLPLSFPGKVLADAASERLFISDTDHNRIVVTDLRGKLIDTIGNGVRSAKDGQYEDAGFDQPQGLAFDGRHLYVADTGNHLIRSVDTREKTVRTIAGTGSLEGFNGFGGKALETSLRSPWDVEIVGQYLYIAMAGSHQIWRYRIKTGMIDPYAGTRAESRRDGPVKRANFAQPSGLAAIGSDLYVADSESNIIRRIDLAKGEVTTLAGGDLFEFGDVDGEGDEVRLQHPLGIDAYGKWLLIADTYNDKIKLLDPAKRTVETFVGSGQEGQTDGLLASFYEPGGLSVAGGMLYVADTNNHAIRVVDLKTKAVSTLKITGLDPPPSAIRSASGGSALKPVEIQVPVVEAPPNSVVRYSVDIDLPRGYHVNSAAPNKVAVSGKGKVTYEKFSGFPFSFSVEIPDKGNAGADVTATVYFCREDNTGVCFIRRVRWVPTVKPVKGAEDPGVVELRASLSP